MITEETKDLIGEILWYSIPFIPLITVPFMLLNKAIKKSTRLAIGLILAFILSILLYFISIAICFRHGIGPI